ncbi:hypothetical protein [Flavobacterium sp.]|uniref:hypothetical protein n=1 Tax=Flavobacterium sp. TaxID=239 RepID=UPI003D6AF357
MRNFLFYFVFFTILGCKNDNTKPSLNNKNRVVGKNELLKGWRTYSNDSIAVNLPSDWKPQHMKNAPLFVPIDYKLNLFYAILSYDASKISCKKYIKEGLKEFSKKNKNSKYVLKKLNLKSTRDCYILELYSSENNIHNKLYSLIYDNGSRIYDFTYKTIDHKKMNDKNYQTFYSVLFSFEIKYDNVFDGSKIIILNEKNMSYKDL